MIGSPSSSFLLPIDLRGRSATSALVAQIGCFSLLPGLRVLASALFCFSVTRSLLPIGRADLAFSSLPPVFLPCSTYHLWTDSSSRKFMATHYPSFLPTFDSYEYPIQRADAIRYFVLHRFGGIYMDLDVGCKRDPAPLLSGDWDVVLMKTIPVSLHINQRRGNRSEGAD